MRQFLSSWGMILLCLLTWAADIAVIHGETAV